MARFLYSERHHLCEIAIYDRFLRDWIFPNCPKKLEYPDPGQRCIGCQSQTLLAKPTREGPTERHDWRQVKRGFTHTDQNGKPVTIPHGDE